MTREFRIDFPMFSKIEVNGEGAANLFKWLKAEQPGDAETSDISWNFEKFLVNASGEAVARWAPPITPEDVGSVLTQYL